MLTRLLIVGIVLLLAAVTRAESTEIPGRLLSLNSAGATDNAAAVLKSNGFVGTYIRVEKAGDVAITIRAAGKGAPHMNVGIADEKAGFDVAETPAEYSHKCALPPGTYVVRIEMNNAKPGDSRVLHVHSIRIDGDAVVLLDNTDAHALAAADTYINNFRRGRATMTLPDVAPGTLVRVKLKRHAFNFGVVASGTVTNKYFFDDPTPGSDAWRVQKFMFENFNAVVPGNSGKWAHNEEVRGKVTMDLADAIARFAQKHNMRMRMHTLLWDTNQQPAWASELLTKAVAGDKAAKEELRKAVGERMEYYLVQRGKNYYEIDLLNEQYHRPRWWQAYGADGLAEIYNAAAAAIQRGGGNALMFTNEYNVLQWSSNPLANSGPDPYANWYREHVELLQNAGGNVGGVGVQYYARNSDGERRGNPHSPARMTQVFQNLSIPGRPLALTEFGIQSVGNPTPANAADILEDSVRTRFGTPAMTGFLVWGFWEKEMWDQANRGALVNADWELLPAGRRWQGLMREWDTDVTVVADEIGRVSFTGFYGDYELTAGDKTIPFTHSKRER